MKPHGQREQPPARQPLAVEDEDVAQIDQRGAGFALAENGEHRQAYRKGDLGEPPGRGQPEALPPHDERQHQRRGDLRDFCRLELHRAEFEPGMRTLDVAAQKNHEYQQHQHDQIGRRRQHLPQLRVDHEQDDHVDREHHEHPEELLPAAASEVEDRTGFAGMDGRVYADPADHHEREVAEHQPPVDGLPQPPAVGI